VLRQVCPSCLRTVDVPDTAAGTTVECPACRVPFPVPGKYSPSVEAPKTVMNEAAPAMPPAPPGLASAAMPSTPSYGTMPPAAGSMPLPSAPAASGTSGISLSPLILDWAPVACFTLILMFTFFSWVGLFPGGYKAYSQSPWGALTGSFTTDHFSEEVIKMEGPIKKVIGSNFALLLPYLLGLMLATVLAWADRFVTMAQVTALPTSMSFVQRLWTMRFPLIAGLAVVLLLLFALQYWTGYGLETAVNQIVAADFTERLVAAKGSSTAEQKIIVEAGMKLGSYQVQTTTMLSIVALLHVAAVVAAACRFWLYRRGTKPLPRLSFDW